MSAAAITSAELAEIKARVDAATPGTWTVDDSEAAIGWDVVATGEDNLCGWWVANGAPGEGAFCEEADARFVAHARTDVPRLVAEVERLRGILANITCLECVPTRSVLECEATHELVGTAS